MKFYHGTSYECAIKILQKGFGGYDQETVWNCSDEDYTYAWMQDENDPDEPRRSRATESAVLAAAKYGSNKEEIVVFTFEMPDKIGNEWAIEDDSCPNMFGAYAFDSAWLNKNIKIGTVRVLPEVVKAYVPGFRWFYLAGCAKELLDLSEQEAEYIRIAEKSDGSIYCELQDLIFYNDFRPISVPDDVQAGVG